MWVCRKMCACTQSQLKANAGDLSDDNWEQQRKQKSTTTCFHCLHFSRDIACHCLETNKLLNMIVFLFSTQHIALLNRSIDLTDQPTTIAFALGRWMSHSKFYPHFPVTYLVTHFLSVSLSETTDQL